MRFCSGLQSVVRELRRRLEQACPFLFPPRGRRDTSRPVCVRTLQHRLARLAARAGVKEHVTLTSLRKALTRLPDLCPKSEAAPGLAQAAG